MSSSADTGGKLRWLAPRYWSTWLTVLCWRSLTLLPWRVRLAVGAALGELLRWLTGRRRTIARANIAACAQALGAESDLERKHFQSLGISFAEAATAWWSGKTFLTDRELIAEPEGIEIIQQFQREGRGVLLLPMHCTCLEILPQILAPKGEVEFCMIAREQNNPLLEAVIGKGRRRRCLHQADRFNPWSMLEALRKGQVCLYFADQDYGRKSSIFSDFLGIPAATSILGRRLAKRGKAAVMLAHYYRKNGRYYGVYKNFPQYLTADSDRQATDMLNKEFEAVIRQAPEQWMWIHRRFKTRPKGAAHIYSGKLIKT